jgi:hypothetical protein
MGIVEIEPAKGKLLEHARALNSLFMCKSNSTTLGSRLKCPLSGAIELDLWFD